MLEFQTETPQYGINVTSIWFPTEYAGLPYWEASVRNQCIISMISNWICWNSILRSFSVWNQCNFSMVSYWICWNSILRSLSTKSMHLQYDFLLNMLEFHIEEPQYGINVTSIWFPHEYAEIPDWEASVGNQAIFSRISYWLLTNHTEGNTLCLFSMICTEYAGISYWEVSVWNQHIFNIIYVLYNKLHPRKKNTKGK